MAVSTIERKVKIVYVDANAQGTVSSAGGNADVTLDFTPPSNSVYIGTVLQNVRATSTVNNLTALVPIYDTSNQSMYRVVSTSAQTITIYARKIYLVTH